MKLVKYICKKCKYAEPLTKKDYILMPLRELIFTSGIAFIVILVLIGYVFLNPEKSTFIEKFDFTGSSLTYSAYKPDKELRELALNITDKCKDAYNIDELERCYSENIYIYIRDFDYALGNYKNRQIYPVKETIKLKYTDCKGYSYTFTALASQVGLDVQIKCNKKHCYPIVNFRDGEVFVTDPTSNIYGYWDDWKDYYE